MRVTPWAEGHHAVASLPRPRHDVEMSVPLLLCRSGAGERVALSFRPVLPVLVTGRTRGAAELARGMGMEVSRGFGEPRGSPNPRETGAYLTGHRVSRGASTPGRRRRRRWCRPAARR